MKNVNNTIKHMREAKSSANCTSWGNKIVSVVLSVVLLGFGWPAVNPAEVYAEDSAANAGGGELPAGWRLRKQRGIDRQRDRHRLSCKR